jgi:pimeloyl-ACP methyl ester carboxylesterase
MCIDGKSQRLAEEVSGMTLLHEHPPASSWTEPDGIAPRGTLIVFPGRGEQPGVYERFARRIASDGYRVHVVTDPAAGAALAESQAASVVSAAASGPRPVVLVGSDTGALFAAGLAASRRLSNVDALVLAGLPVAEARPGTAGRGASSPGGAGPGGLALGAVAGSWEAELEARTACPTHQGRLAGPILRRGALYDPVPDGWVEFADLAALRQPVLAIHGTDDLLSPLPAARARYAAARHAELVSITGGRHDALNDITHRTVAATIVLFLERLRLGPGQPAIAVNEEL